MAEAVEVCKTLEREQYLSLEISEEIDAYQTRHGGYRELVSSDRRL
jgi:hypothetical protein